MKMRGRAATGGMQRSVLLVVLLAMLTPGVGWAGLPEAINEARTEGCHVAAAPLTDNARLRETARLLAQGIALAAAQQKAGYHPVHIVSLIVSGVPDERSLAQSLTQNLCQRLATPGLSELGAYRNGVDVYIALGEPFIAPDSKSAAVISARLLELTNAARAQPRRCGNTDFPAAEPLSLNPQLQQAAQVHAQDMAAHGFLEHRGTDGTGPAERITRTGYEWSAFGENVASGDATAESVVEGWLASPAHCENIMRANYRQMGVAFAVNFNTEGRVYWTQVFGTPSSAPREGP